MPSKDQLSTRVFDAIVDKFDNLIRADYGNTTMLQDPESSTLERDFPKYRAYNDRSTIFVVQRGAASTAGTSADCAAGSNSRPSSNVSPQLLKIVVHPVKDRQARRFDCWSDSAPSTRASMISLM
jgi:hypothetical protein